MTRRNILKSLCCAVAMSAMEVCGMKAITKAFDSKKTNRIARVFLKDGVSFDVLAEDVSYELSPIRHPDGSLIYRDIMRFFDNEGNVTGSAFADRVDRIEDAEDPMQVPKRVSK